MSQDIILLTVDSWRHDTADLVPNLSERLSKSGELICAGAATNWAFPPILGSTYYPDAYENDGGLDPDLTSLPQVLSEEGYATGGFVACNPYVSKWGSHFDEFWNADLSEDSSEWYSSMIEKWLSRLYRTAFLRKRVPATEIAQRASRWYATQDKPRFLWMHIMEPHLPYYPGIRKAQDVGLLKSYRSIVSFHRHGDETPSKHVTTQRSLYEKCVDLFNERVPDLLDFVDDDAVVVVFGDHGEEFEHGHYDHERLYDECVKVPLYHKNINPSDSEDGPTRQIDIALRILDSIGVKAPDKWDGQTTEPISERPALMLTPEPGPGLIHAGIRSDSKKLIRSFDQETGELQRTEFYDLSEDPDETRNLADKEQYGSLGDRLNEFVERYDSALDMDASTGVDSVVVESRLEDLGYK